MTVAAALRERISRGDLRPGTRLPTQQDLSAEFGVNRTVVRHALGTLKADGLISMGRGAPATVALPAPTSPVSAGSPQPAAVLLTDRLQAAFRAEHITVDCFSLTTETLNNALMQALHGINTQEFAPRSITVRVLLPSNGAHLALPRLVSDPADDRPLDRLRGITHTWTDALRASVESLRVRHAVPDVTLDIRSVAVTPLHKLYLLNRTESLMGYYPVVTREVPIGDEEREIYDVTGLDTTLFRSSSGPDSRSGQEAAFVESSLKWFDSLWNSIAHPVAPG